MTANTNTNFFSILLIIVSALAFWILLPFFTPILLATALAVIFTPLNNWLSAKLFHKKCKSTIASLITLLFILMVIIIPLIILSAKIYLEIAQIYKYLTDKSTQIEIISFLNASKKWLSSYFPGDYFEKINFADSFSKVLNWFLSNLSTIFSNMTWFIINTFVLFFGLFYFLRNGHEIKQQIVAISPLEEDDNKRLIKNIQQGIYSIFGGSIVVALIQGVLVGIGLAIFRVPSPVLWGAVASLTSLIPGVGTSLVLIPAILYLFFSSTILMAIGLLIWGVVFVGLIDNLLKPILIAPGMRLHPFLIFLSILGGLAVFGLVGMLLGPLVLAFLFALLEIYKGFRKKTV